MTGWLLGSVEPLVNVYDALLVDLDGVVYIGPTPIDHAAAALESARQAGVHLAYVTNNASRTPEEVASHLRECGLVAVAGDVVTSSQAGARLVSEHVAPGSSVLAIGGPGVGAALRERGFTVVTSAAHHPAAVMQGFGPDVGWRDLAEGTFAVTAGAVFVATNADFTFPAPGGRAPGNGSLVAVITGVTGVKPFVAGKPESPLVVESIDRVGSERPLMVGDRLDTDIEAAVRLSLPSLLVMTGVTGIEELLAAPSHSRPTYIGDDLRSLHTSHPRVDATEAGAQCGEGEVVLEAGELRVTSISVDGLDVVRAASVACWIAADSGRSLDLQAASRAVESAVAAASPSASDAR